MSFDRLAPHYRWMEWLLAGGKLQRCRTAFLSALPRPRHALLLGEGNERFLVELLRAHPGIRFTCLDASARMLQGTQAKLKREGIRAEGGRFIQASVLEWIPPAAEFDLIVSNFFLDCFPPAELEVVIRRMTGAAAPPARWLVADFREPPEGWQRWRARWILRSMYWFFRHATALPAHELTPPDDLLQRCGFRLVGRRLHEWGLLHSDLWERETSSPPAHQEAATWTIASVTLPS